MLYWTGKPELSAELFHCAFSILLPLRLISVLGIVTCKTPTCTTDTDQCVCLPADQYPHAKTSFLLQWCSLRRSAHLRCQNQWWIFLFLLVRQHRYTNIKWLLGCFVGFFLAFFLAFLNFFPRRLKWLRETKEGKQSSNTYLHTAVLAPHIQLCFSISVENLRTATRRNSRCESPSRSR